MQIQILKSKIHRVKVTGADLNYIGSITVDKDLMEASNLIAGEKVQVVNINNGERIETYVIPWTSLLFKVRYFLKTSIFRIVIIPSM